MQHGCRILVFALLALGMAPKIGLAKEDPRLAKVEECIRARAPRTPFLTSSTDSKYRSPSLRGSVFKYLFRMPSENLHRARARVGDATKRHQIAEFEEYLGLTAMYAKQVSDPLKRACYLKCVTNNTLEYEESLNPKPDADGNIYIDKEFAKKKLALTFKALPRVYAEGRGSCMEFTAIYHELAKRSGLQGEPVTNESLTHAFYSIVVTDQKTQKPARHFLDPQYNDCKFYELELAPEKGFVQSLPEWYQKLKDSWRDNS